MVAYREPPRRRADIIVDTRGRAMSRGRWKARRARPALGLAVIALLLAGPAGETTSSVMSAGVAALVSAAETIAARSPGLRNPFLSNSKKAPKARALPRPKPRPVARVAPPVRVPLVIAPPPETPLAFNDTALIPGPIAPLIIGAPFVEALNGICACNFVYLPDPGSGVIVIGGGGSGGALVPPPGPPPAAIPEPGRWAQMILGFAALGWMWRRRRVVLRLLSYAPQLRLGFLRA